MNKYHVSKAGNENNPGSVQSPFLAIQMAAETAMPGDVITVHEGTCRERIVPPRGGKSDAKRITYRVADGECAEIKGSEIVDNWEIVCGNTWKTTIPNSFFGNYNPYREIVKGD